MEWIELAGTANTRDLGGTPVDDGGRIRSHRLLRSDNLQDLTPGDVRRLVEEYDLRAVADLRSDIELATEGPGPLSDCDRVRTVHLSLLPAPATTTDATAVDRPPRALDGGVLLPWQGENNDRRHATARDTYRRYLDERPDSVLGALRLITQTDGATLINCAAGKDRTGVITAFALAEVGVGRDAIVADYAITGQRVPGILARLAARPTYGRDIDLDQPERHRPRVETFEAYLADLDAIGGVRGWLRDHGWTEQDAAQLRSRLVDASTQ